MPPIRGQQSHKWTEFEMRAMLCLIVKGVHVEDHNSKSNVYLDFATKLNESLNGRRSEGDIHKKEITRMLDHILVEHKHVLGKGGLAERQFGGRITHSLWMAFKRSLDLPRLDFDGSIAEWDQWRRKKVLGIGDEEDDEAVVHQGLVSPDLGGPKRARQPKRAPGRENRWRSKQTGLSAEYIEDISGGDHSRLPHTRGHDAFEALPSKLRSAPKYQWAKGAAKPDSRRSLFPSYREFMEAQAAEDAPQNEYYNRGAEAHGDIRAPLADYRDTRREACDVPTPKKARKSDYRSMVSGDDSEEDSTGLMHHSSSVDGIHTPASVPQNMEPDILLARSMSPPVAMEGALENYYVVEGTEKDGLEEGEI